MTADTKSAVPLPRQGIRGDQPIAYINGALLAMFDGELYKENEQGQWEIVDRNARVGS